MAETAMYNLSELAFKMNKNTRVERILNNSDKKKLSVHDYATALKIAGFTLEEAIDRVKQLAIRDRVKNVYTQTRIVALYNNTKE